MTASAISTSPLCGNCRYVRWNTQQITIRCQFYDEDLKLKHQGDTARVAKCQKCLENQK